MKVLYFVMVVLQFSAVCLVMILWASVLAFLSILISYSIHGRSSMGLACNGGILRVWISCSVVMFGSL